MSELCRGTQQKYLPEQRRIENGVFEKMKYPYFYPRKQEWKKYGWEEFVWDDVEFCLRARENGHDIWIDPKIRIGHEKMVVM